MPGPKITEVKPAEAGDPAATPSDTPQPYKPSYDEAMTLLGILGVVPIEKGKFEIKYDQLAEGMGPVMRERLVTWIAQKYDLATIRTMPANLPGGLVASAERKHPADEVRGNRAKHEARVHKR